MVSADMSSDLSGTILPSTITSTITTDLSGVIVSPPPPFSLDDLMNEHAVVLAKETVDRADATAFSNMSIDTIRPQLIAWATGGCEPLYQVASLYVNPPGTCADGVSRSHVDYFSYLIGKTIQEWLDSMTAKTVGMRFTFSHDGVSRINLLVNKAG